VIFRILYRLAPFSLAAYAALLAALSLLPGSGPGILWDKLAHALAYGLFPLAGAPLALAPAAGNRPLMLLGAGAVAWGVGLEIAQYFVPGRVMSAADIAANSIGVACGIGLLLLARRFMPWPNRLASEAESPELG